MVNRHVQLQNHLEFSPYFFQSIISSHERIIFIFFSFTNFTFINRRRIHSLSTKYYGYRLFNLLVTQTGQIIVHQKILSARTNPFKHGQTRLTAVLVGILDPFIVHLEFELRLVGKKWKWPPKKISLLVSIRISFLYKMFI